MARTVLGVIGGSGFYQMKGIGGVDQIDVPTPFGQPSDPFFRGTIGECEVVFLSRHGRGHRFMPSEINFRANIYAMKKLGVDHLVSVSTAGSMREELKPGDLVVATQFIDHTFRRPSTFFGGGIVGHVSLADPVCPVLARELAQAVRETGSQVHEGGVYLCIEGPQFSTRAESNLYRRWGADVISMTAMQEARLAREAEICFATLVLVTDYDCWHESVAAVDIGEILRVMKLNVERAQSAVARLAARIAGRVRQCACPQALHGGIVTDRAVIPPQVATDLAPIIGKYLK
jgi:5'-methylthioadenosine phosphorylase